MKTLLIFLVLCAGVQAQDFGLGSQAQPVVVRQYYSANTFGLGSPVRSRSVLIRPQRVVYEIPAPVVTQTQTVVEMEQSAPTFAPMQVYQPRWRMTRQRQCTPTGCRDVWVRVWR